MKPNSTARLAMAGLLLLISTIAIAQSGGGTCAQYSLNDSVDAAGDTNGNFPVVAAGDVFTFRMTPGTATSASWRIVSDAGGSPGSTLVPGGTVSGTLTYTVTVPGGSGVGFYVDSINGSATITASCGPGSAAEIPTLSEWSMVLLSVMLAATAVVGLRRRQ